ncbi:transglycosylase domain-containing protein, partial [Streptomyces sp. MCAF7]
LTINLSADKAMGGSNYGFQVGSTFKPITAAAALEQGKKPYQRYSSPYEMDYPSPVSTCNGTWSNNGSESLTNEDPKEKGPYGLREALAKSINTYFVQMISDIGVCPVTEMAGKMGVHRADGKKLNQVPAITLGTDGFSPLTMANAYATFANRGIYCTPVFIESITGPGGKALDVPKSSCTRAMSEKTADTMNTLLRGVVEDGTGQKAGLENRPSAGKTGTTDERKAAWFVGYTPNLAGAVWVGGSGSKGVKMEQIRIGGVFHDKVYGADTPGPIWKDAMSGALEGKPADEFVTVPIKDPNEKPRDDDKDHGDKPGRDNGGNNGGNNGGDSPWPDITLPPDVIGGDDGFPGGNRGGTGNGGNG